MFKTVRHLATLAALTCVSALAGCGASDDRSGSGTSSLSSAQSCADEEGAADKVVCNVDADCDSDEFCVNGKCTGADGEPEDSECTPDGTADSADDEADDDANDKIYCAVDADCDSDETCEAGLCTGIPEACSTDADCDSDEACTDGYCEDR